MQDLLPDHQRGLNTLLFKNQLINFLPNMSSLGVGWAGRDSFICDLLIDCNFSVREAVRYFRKDWQVFKGEIEEL